MTIITPRGLKVRIPVPYAFALMARLYPEVSPFRVLKTTEGIESIPGMLAFTFGITAIVNHFPPLHVAYAVFGQDSLVCWSRRFSSRTFRPS